MSRIFWDTMLLIYLLEGDPGFRPRADALLARSAEGATGCSRTALR